MEAEKSASMLVCKAVLRWSLGQVYVKPLVGQF